MDQWVAVIGAGSWGTTLASILSMNQERVLLWSRREELCREIRETRENSRYLPGFRLDPSIEPTTDLERVCHSTRLLLLVVPSHGLRAVARTMGEHLDGEHCIVHATKGIEQGSFKRMSQVLREETCVRKLGVLSGPNLAREIAMGQPAGTLLASNFNEVLQGFKRSLHTDRLFQVYKGRDMVGAEVAGAVKNIVAVAAGVLDGLDLGDNTRALLLTRGLYEMAQVGVSMGASPMTFGGLAGIGDLMATCASPLSRNHQVGERLARGESLEQISDAMNQVAEGVKTARSVHDYAARNGFLGRLPIVRTVYRVIYEGMDVRQAVDYLMSLKTGHEMAELTY